MIHSVSLNEHIIRTLLYYKIFDHPLSANELFYLLPMNSLDREQFRNYLADMVNQGALLCSHKYYLLPKISPEIFILRTQRENYARRKMKIARLMTHVIKRFPFVRGVFLSGDLSKGVARQDSDIDYVIVTAPHRLWICRALLVIFKKVFLLNSKKYFCLNYFVATDQLKLEDQNYYTATEIAHLKPLYNIEIFLRYMNANSWVKRFFPNYKVFALNHNKPNSRRSILQKILEVFFFGRFANHLDFWLMNTMKRIWAKRYPEYDEHTRDKIFRCTPTESCAYVGNFSDKILSLYKEQLQQHGLHFQNIAQ